MRWTLARSKKSMVVIAASFTGVLLFLMGMAITGAENFKDYHVILERMSGLAMGMFIIFLIVSPSFLMANYKRRQGALAYLTLPASSFEKYLSRFLLVTVVWGCCLIVGFLVFDLVQYVIASIVIGREAELGTFSYILNTKVAFFNINGSTSFMHMLFLWLLLLWFQSIYAFGGTFLRKFQWIFVSVILLFGLIVFLSWATGTGARSVATWLMEHKDQLPLYRIILCVVMALFVILNFRLSFRFFKRTQVIQNKWFNV
ncbi:MAG: hypothetical protein IKX36_06115 [Prevotella sp.]|nr:hypothetical protein [Prevotella sp.]